MRLPVTVLMSSLCAGVLVLTGCGSSPVGDSADASADVSGPVVTVAAIPAATTNAPRTLSINATVRDTSGVNTVSASVNPELVQGSSRVSLTSTNGTNWTGSVMLKGNGTFSDLPVTVTVVGTDSQGNASTATQGTTIPAAVPPPAAP